MNRRRGGFGDANQRGVDVLGVELFVEGLCDELLLEERPLVEDESLLVDGVSRGDGGRGVELLLELLDDESCPDDE